jgi:serine/threonine protein kinase
MVQHKTHISTDWKWAGDTSVFQMEEVLGKGASGIVLKAKVRDIGFDVAIKKVKQSNKRVQEELEKEIEVLKKCKHVNIVAYYGTKLEKEEVWIIMVCLRFCYLMLFYVFFCLFVFFFFLFCFLRSLLPLVMFRTTAAWAL